MLRLALRVTLRECRATPWRFAFAVAAIAIGTGLLGGIKNLSASFRQALKDQSRDWSAADLSARTNSFPAPHQIARIATLGAEWTIVTETIGTAGSRLTGFQTVAVKAVDPRKYPFYGPLLLSGGLSLAETLSDGSVAVSSGLRARMESATQAGSLLRLGDAGFRIGATIQSEPDRFAVMPLQLPRVILSREAFDKAGILRFGGRATHRILFRLKPGADLPALKQELRELFPDGEVLDASENDPDVVEALEQATAYLALLSLIALVTAGAGVAVVMHSHLAQRMSSIAVMKAIGGRSGQVFAIHAIQTLVLGCAGAAAGLAAGRGVEAVLLRVFNAYLPLRVTPVWSVAQEIQTFTAGLAMPLSLTIPVLAQVLPIRPLSVWRGDWQGFRAPLWAPAAWAAAILPLVWWIHGNAAAAAGFSFAVASVVAAALASSALLLRVLGRLSRRRLPAPWKHGIANLHRPGNYSAPVLAAMSASVAFLVASANLQDAITGDWEGRSPFRGYNLFLLNVSPTEKPALDRDLAGTPGLLGSPRFASFARVRLGSRDVLATTAGARPEEIEVIAGEWWSAHDTTPLAAVHHNVARRLHLEVGQNVRLFSGGREISCTIAALHRSRGVNAVAYDFTLNPVAARNVPFIYNGAVQAEPSRLAQVEAALAQAHPGIVVMNAEEALSYVRYATDRIILMVRGLAGFAIFGGLMILAAGVASTRLRRMKETAVLKTLGASSRKLMRIVTVEFAVLGVYAGLIGVALGTILSSLALSLMFHSPPIAAGWKHWAAAVAASAASIIVAGWSACFPIVARKPMAVFRLDS